MENEKLPILLNAILISAVSEIILSPKLSLGIVASEYISLTESFLEKNQPKCSNFKCLQKSKSYSKEFNKKIFFAFIKKS